VGFGDRIRILRKVANLSQDDLAKLAGMGRNTIGRMESNTYIPHHRSLVKLATALGVDVQELLGESAPLAPPGQRETPQQVLVEISRLHARMERIEHRVRQLERERGQEPPEDPGGQRKGKRT
jgi:transcriptional regulator with XRE-family HTH domain